MGNVGLRAFIVVGLAIGACSHSHDTPVPDATVDAGSPPRDAGVDSRPDVVAPPVDSGTDATGCAPCGECEECVAGACVAVSDGTACAGGSCQGGLCCTGCLQDSTCMPGDEPAACGSGGSACTSCACDVSTCVDGACRLPDGSACPSVEWSVGRGFHPHAMAFDADGNLYVAGWVSWLEARVDLGDGPRETSGRDHAIVASYDPDGGLRWGHAFPGGSFESIALDGAGRVFVTGHVAARAEALELPGRVLRGLFVIALDAGGRVLWAVDGGEGRGTSVAVGASGLYVAGVGVFGLDLGCGPITPSVMDLVMYMARLDPATGACLANWAHGRPSGFDAGVVEVKGMVVDARGVTVAGYYDKLVVTFGGPIFTLAGPFDGFVATYAADGTHRASARYGGAGYDMVYALVSDGGGSAFAVGVFEDMISLGAAGTLTGGERQGLLFRAQPGAESPARVVGPGIVWIHDGARGSRSELLATGWVTGELVIAGAALDAGERAGFVAAFDPATLEPVWGQLLPASTGWSIAALPTGRFAVGIFPLPPEDRSTADVILSFDAR